MVQVIQASNLELPQVEEKFNLSQSWDLQFFSEWQENLPELSDFERQWLDQIRLDFLGIVKYSSSEEIVKLFALSPLLSLAGLARHPFIPIAENLVEIAFEDKEEVIRGKVDLLVLHQQIWTVMIEAKRHRFNVQEALPQALFHILSSPNSATPVYGLLCNGTEYLFLKLQKQKSFQYGLSRLYSMINPGNDLYAVLSILKHLRNVVLI